MTDIEAIARRERGMLAANHRARTWMAIGLVALAAAGCSAVPHVLLVNGSGEAATLWLMDRGQERSTTLSPGAARMFKAGVASPQGVVRLAMGGCEYAYRLPDDLRVKAGPGDWLVRARVGPDHVVHVIAAGPAARKLAREQAGYERHGIALPPTSRICREGAAD